MEKKVNVEKELKKEIKKKKKTEVEELKDSLQRLQAEFENYKKRTEKEKGEFVKFAEKNLILDLLTVLDNFELALKNKDNGENFSKGMEMIYAQLFDVLEKKGLKKINAVNRQFDPYVHEALMQEESDKEEGIILEVLQKGYLLNENVLRHSKVKVSKKKVKK